MMRFRLPVSSEMSKLDYTMMMEAKKNGRPDRSGIDSDAGRLE